MNLFVIANLKTFYFLMPEGWYMADANGNPVKTDVNPLALDPTKNRIDTFFDVESLLAFVKEHQAKEA